MDHKPGIRIGLGLALLGCAPAWPADSVKPLNIKTGQWESTVTTQRTGNQSGPVSGRTPEEVQERAKAMPPGKIGPLPAQTITKRSCVDNAALKGSFGGYAENPSCKRTVLNSTPTHQEFRIECVNNGIISSGIVEMDAPDPEHVKGKVKMSMNPDGQVRTLDMTINARWLAATCPAGK